MVVVKDIKETEFNLIKELDNENNKELRDILEYIPKDELGQAFPTKSKFTVSFELHDTNASLANGIRRCLIDEIEIASFDFNEYKDIETDDIFIPCDLIKQRIDLLPVAQDIDYNIKSKTKDNSNAYMKFELFKKNDSDRIIDILSDNLKIVGESNGYDIRDVVNAGIPLHPLRPGKYIKINNITISKGIAIDNAGKYNTFSNVTYKILDAKQLIETPLETSGKSSMTTNSTKFYISYDTHRNIKNPKKMMIKCCDTLIDKFEIILEDMKNIKNSDTKYISDILSLETHRNTKKIFINDEYWTAINLITRYVYDITKGTIEFITPSLIHPEKEIGVVSIIHPEFSTVIQNALKKIISDLNIVKKAFSDLLYKANPK